MVIQVHGQRVHRAQPHWVLDLLRGIGNHHAQLGAVGRQLEPLAAHSQHLGVQFNRGGAHAQLFVAKLGDGPCSEAQLHGMAFGHLGRVGKQQPGHHALHVFQLNLERLINTHGALNPGRSQMQMANLAIVRHAHFRQLY
ncbi:hypothetical protein D3C72_1800190 [compost metagenome]